MIVSNQILYSFIIIGFTMIILGLFSFSSNPDFLFSIGTVVLEYAGIFLLLQNGTFIKTVYFRIAIGCVALLIIASLFKIMHWPFGIEVNLVVTGSMATIAISYFLHFLKKSDKKRLDILKLFWVFARYGGSILVLHHLITKDFLIFSAVLMILILMGYILPRIKSKTLFK